MAKLSALPNLPITHGENKCDGCGEDLNILTNHLRATIKVERAVVIDQPRSEYEAVVRGEERTPEEILKTANSDEEEAMVTYLGFRSGTAEEIRCHDDDCLMKAVEKRKNGLKLKFHKEAEDSYESVGRSAK